MNIGILASLEKVVRFSNIIKPFRLFILCCKSHSNSLTIYLMKYVHETGDHRAAGVKLQRLPNPGRWGILDVPPVRTRMGSPRTVAASWPRSAGPRGLG